MRFDFSVEIDPSWRTLEYLGMAKLAPNRVAWTPGSAADIVGYRLRIVPRENELDYDIEYWQVGKDVTEYDFGADPGFEGTEGVFHLGVSSVDAHGNESEIAVLRDLTIDTVPPDPPTNLRRLD